MKKKKFQPKCLTGEESLAISNRNILLPCCYVDNQGFVKRPELEALIEVSNINDHTSLEDIVKQKEWLEFYKLLVKGRDTQKQEHIPTICANSCSRIIRKENWIN